ncbi:MAG: TetR/AcrR family transcriptional regulator [Tepidisphaeraceae bacterium]
MSRIAQKPDQLSVRDRLLDAAEQVAVRDGVGDVTLESVAREAGVSKGGLLYHFPTKSALITAIVERLARHCDADHDQALAQTAPGAGAFTRAYLSARAEPLDPQEEPVHTALLAAVGTDQQYLDPFRKRLSEWQARLESDGIDPATATIVRLAIDGLCLCRLMGLPVPTGDLRRRVLESLHNMTQSPPGDKGGKP